MKDWKCTVNCRDNRHARTFRAVYHVQAREVNEARSRARLAWLDEWEGQDVTWLACKVEELTEPPPLIW